MPKHHCFPDKSGFLVLTPVPPAPLPTIKKQYLFLHGPEYDLIKLHFGVNGLRC